MKRTVSLPFCIAILGTAILAASGEPPSRAAIGEQGEVLINGKPFFPIMQCFQRAKDIGIEKRLGINTFVWGGPAKAYCEAARREGVYAVPSYDVRDSADRQAVMSNPAFLGWMFEDEPDLPEHRVDPGLLAARYREIKAGDDGHLVFLNITGRFYREESPWRWMGDSSERCYDRYLSAADVIGFDYYPICARCRPDWIYRVGRSQAQLAAKCAAGKKSSFQWIECMRYAPRRCDSVFGTSRGLESGPRPSELRDEVWLAIANGANGIGYFTYSENCPGHTPFCLGDSLIAAVTAINREITGLTDVLCSRDLDERIAISMPDGVGMVCTRSKRLGHDTYIIAVYVPGGAGRARVSMTSTLIRGNLRVINENRAIRAEGGYVSDTFSARDPVHIYRLRESGRRR